MTISVLIPCYNEELSIKKSLESWLNQTRKPDQILVVDDGSTDSSVDIISSFGSKVKLIVLPKKTGNKSYVQEAGLPHVTSEIFIATDADTIPDTHFVEYVEQAFSEKDIVAFCGHVESIENNWLTACREIEYTIGQYVTKKAQQEIGYVYVIPGCAGAFLTQYFRENIHFDHDTITEDLDFTYKFHAQKKHIFYDHRALVYTQDPNSLSSYVKQVSRWYAGNIQNAFKHWRVLKRPVAALEIFSMFGDLFLNFFFLVVFPILNARLSVYYLAFLLISAVFFGGLAAFAHRKYKILLCSPLYVVVAYLNALIFFKELITQLVLPKNLEWKHVSRWEV